MQAFNRSIFRYGLYLLIFVYSANQPAMASWWWPFGDKGIDYKIEIEGVDEQTRQWFEKLKLDEKSQKQPPENLAELEQAAMGIENRLNLALKAKGYYEAQIDQRMDRETVPPIIHYKIISGPQTHISIVKFEWVDDELSAPALSTLSLKAGDAVDAESINNDALVLQDAIGKDACLLSLSVSPVLRLHPSQGTAELIYNISHGPRANFGETWIEGNKRTKLVVITRLLTWRQGECFTEEKVKDSQSALFSSQLFSSVKIKPGTQVGDNGEVPVVIELSERSPRTITAGANYDTDKGFGVKFGWEHRNFSGGAEKVNVNAVLAQQEQSLAATERIPAFKREDQVLALAGGIKHEDTDAYTSDSLNLSAGLERKITPYLNAGAGIAYDLKQTDDIRTGSQTYSLISLPVFGDYDTRDNAQDATKGIYAHGSLTPYQDMLDANLQFFKTTITGQTYYSSDITYKPTLALRASLGSIAGSPYRDLPADLRYYAGGGGSVRGYSYQSLSQHFAGAPVGGGSIVELSSELRLRFTDTIGAVAFFDAGNAFAKSLPDLGGKLYYGTGLGARYYSAVGPIRVDVGVPLNGKDIGETGYQIYVSLGQAF